MEQIVSGAVSSFPAAMTDMASALACQGPALPPRPNVGL